MNLYELRDALTSLGNSVLTAAALAWENRRYFAVPLPGPRVYGRCMGGGKRDSQGGGKPEKKGKLRKIAQYFAIEKMQRGGNQQI